MFYEKKYAGYVPVLRSCEIFEGLSEESFEKIFERGGFAELEQKECAVSEDSTRRGIGVVLSGELLAYNRSGGRSAVLNRFCRGHVFGAAAMWRTQESYPSYVVAKRRSVVFFLSEKSVEESIAEVPEFALAYARFLTGRIRFLNRKIAGFTSKNVKERLLQYAAAACADGGGRFALNVSAAACRLAVTRTALYKALKDLCDDGIVARDGKYIYLVSGADGPTEPTELSEQTGPTETQKRRTI